MNPAEVEIEQPVKPQKPAVLFVDDEKRVLNSMRAMFRREYNIFLTTRGDEALKIIEENDIDVVVADQRMPIMTGVEVLSAIKKQSPDTVRILLTGYADLEAIEGAMNDGEVFRFLSKPCAAEELRGTIKLATEIAKDTSGSDVDLSDDPEDDSFLENMSAESVPDEVARQLSVVSTGANIKVDDIPVSGEEVDLATPEVSLATVDGLPTDEAQFASPANQTSAQTEESVDLVESTQKLATPDLTSKPKSIPDNDPVEIVMSGDGHHVVDTDEPEQAFDSTTVIEEAPVLTPPEPEESDDSGHHVNVVGTGKYKVSIIVFTPDEQFAKSIGRSLQDYFYTFHASNIAHLMHGITKIAPAVLITDISEDPDVIQQLTANLKQKVPEMVTMVASKHRDAELMVKLINFGQVFRFIDKPLSSTACKRHVREAIKKHIQLRDNPDLVQRHQVVKSNDRSRLPAKIGKLFSGLGRVRKLWGRKTK